MFPTIGFSVLGFRLWFPVYQLWFLVSQFWPSASQLWFLLFAVSGFLVPVSLGFGFLAFESWFPASGFFGLWFIGFWFLGYGLSFLDSGSLFMVSMVPGSMVSALRRSSSDCERNKAFVFFLKSWP